jgi:anaerobic selenocysteine-containing dehydrogenase
MSTGDSQRAHEAFRALDFAVATELFMTPTAELCDYVLPATSFLEIGNLAAGFEHRPKENFIYNIARQWFPLWLSDVRTWMIFELAKRVGLGREFWEGDIEAGYEHECSRPA